MTTSQFTRPLGDGALIVGAFGFAPVALGGQAKLGYRPSSDRRWFECRYCRVVFVGKPAWKQPAWQERESCFAHEALCTERPADQPVDAAGRAAVERVYGALLREQLATLDADERDLVGDPGVNTDRLALIEQCRGETRAALALLGLPVDRVES